MRKTIKKNITKTEIHCSAIEVTDNGIQDTPMPMITVIGDYDNVSKAEKIARQQYKGKHLVITKLHKTQENYEMDLSTFIENATKVETNEQLQLSMEEK